MGSGSPSSPSSKYYWNIIGVNKIENQGIAMSICVHMIA